MILLDMVWPATYFMLKYYDFWYVIFGTIFIEMIVIKLILNQTYIKSLFISLIANISSGLIGTILLWIAMLFWHLVADRILGETFHTINWIATFILMLLGSIIIEIFVIKIIYKINLKKLILPLSLGNILTYILVSWFLIYRPTEIKHDTYFEDTYISYFPNKTSIILNNNYSLTIDTNCVFVDYEKNPQLRIFFQTDTNNEYQPLFEIADIKYEAMPSLPDKTNQKLFFKSGYNSDTITIFLKLQLKNDTMWNQPKMIDTLVFIRKLKQSDIYDRIK